MALTVTTKPMENQQLSMTIEVDETRIEQEMRKEARKISRTVNIPGFRKGRVPYHVLVQFLGRKAVIQEFADKLGEEVYKEALAQEELHPYAPASINDVDLGRPVRFHLTVPLAPQVTLGPYRSLRMEEEEVEVDEEKVQERLQEILEEHSDYQEVDRASQYGDLMTIDIRGVVLDEEGNETDVIVFDEEDWDVTPDNENPMEPSGLDEALLDLAPAAEKSFPITWPEDSPSMHASKTVHFTVKVHKIQSYQAPELNDEIAQIVGPDYETAADLLNDLRETALEDAKAEAENIYREKVLNALVEMGEFDYPPAAIERQIDQIVQNNHTQLRQMGLTGIEQYLEMTNQSLEDYRTTLREEAETVLHRELIIEEIVQREHIGVSDEEYEDFIETVAGSLPEDADEADMKDRADLIEMMSADRSRPYLNQEILREKSIKRILEIARGEELPDLPPDTGPERADTSAAEVDHVKVGAGQKPASQAMT